MTSSQPRSLKCAVIPVTPFQQNCSILWEEASRRAAIVDPGGDLERIKAFIVEQKLTPGKILLTHAHIDHAGGTAALARDLAVPIEGPRRAS